MNIYHSSQIFDELNAPFAHFSRFCAVIGGIMGKNIAVLASGSGTNAENIIRYFREKGSACVALVLTNRQNAFVLERAKGLGVPCVWFAKSDWESGELVLSTLREHDIDFVVLAGFLARVPDNILHAYPNKMINIHPSLLPKFGGKGMYGDRVHEAVIASGERKAVLPSIIRMSIMTKAALSASRNAPYCRAIRRRSWRNASTGWSMNTIRR